HGRADDRRCPARAGADLDRRLSRAPFGPGFARATVRLHRRLGFDRDLDRARDGRSIEPPVRTEGGGFVRRLPATWSDRTATTFGQVERAREGLARSCAGGTGAGKVRQALEAGRGDRGALDAEAARAPARKGGGGDRGD